MTEFAMQDRATLIRDDNRVYIDGYSAEVDLSGLHPAVHAIQYNAKTGTGEIEWVAVGNAKPHNVALNYDTLMNMVGPQIEEALALIRAALKPPE